MPSASSLLRRLKRKAGEIIPDEVEDAVRRGVDVRNDIVGGVFGRPDQIIPRLTRGELPIPGVPWGVASVRDVYHGPVDALKEVGATVIEARGRPSTIGERLQTARATRARPGEERSTIAGGLFDRSPIAGLGRAWRDRPDTLTKFGVDIGVDPAIVGTLGTTPGKLTASTLARALARTGSREIAAPIAGAAIGQEIGEAVGGESGARIGRSVGALAGGFGPNVLGGRRAGEAGTSVSLPPARPVSYQVERPQARSRQAALVMGIAPTTPVRRQAQMVTLQDETGTSVAPWQLSRRQIFDRSSDEVVWRAQRPEPEAGRRYYHAVPNTYRLGDPIYTADDLGSAWKNKWGDNYFDTDKVALAEKWETAQSFLYEYLDGRGFVLAVDVPKDVSLFRNSEGFVSHYDSIPSDWVTPVVTHRQAVQEAIRRGEAVPGAVLADFPDLQRGAQRVQQRAPARGIAPLGRAAPKPKDTIRLYHGTGSAFDAPEAGKFDPDGLFGPGYYLTSDPRVAGGVIMDDAQVLRRGYAQERPFSRRGTWQNPPDFQRERVKLHDRIRTLDRWLSRESNRAKWPEFEAEKVAVQRQLADLEDQALAIYTGAQVRPVDVPRDLRLLDVEQRIGDGYRDIGAFLQRDRGQAALTRWQELGPQPPRGQDAYQELIRQYGGPDQANAALSRAGYDGLKYSGGRRIPLKDDAGKAIEHDAYVIFPESLPKITNALSGTPGGLLPAESTADLARLPPSIGRSGIIDVRTDLPFQPMTADEVQAFLAQLRSEPRQKLTEALELNWQGALKDVFGTAIAPRMLADWRRLLTSGGAAQGAAANVIVGALQGETDPDQIIENALMGGALGVGARRARLLGSATGMPGAKGPVLGAQAAKGAKGAKAPRPGQQAFPGMAPTPAGRGVLGGAASLSRELSLGGDVGQVAARGVLGTFQSIGANPVGAVRNVPLAWYRGVRSALSPQEAARYRQSPTWQRFGSQLRPQRVTQGGVSIQGGVIEGFGQRHAVLGAPARLWTGADQMVFDRFFPTFNAETSRAVADALPRRFARRYGGQSAVDGAVADWVQGISLGVPKDAATVNRFQRVLGAVADKIPLISPNRARGDIGIVTKPFTGGLEGYLARRLWAGALVTSLAVGAGLTWMLEGTPPTETLDPRSPKSLVNPANRSRFLGAGIGSGNTISPFQAIKAPARLLFAAPAGAIGAAAQAYTDPDAGGDIAEAAQILLATWAEGQLGEVKDWYTNRLAIPLRTGLDVVRNRDFFGNPITTVSFAENPLGWAEQVGLGLVRSQAPVFLSPFTEKGPPTVPGTAPTLQQRGLDTLTGWLLNQEMRRPPRLPEDVAASLNAEVRRHGVDPGGDPLDAYYRLNLPQDVQARFEAEHPELRRFLDAKAAVRSPTTARPEGKDAYFAFTTTQRLAKRDRDDQLRALEGMQLTGPEYRRQRSAIMSAYANGMRGLKQYLFDTTDEAEADAMLATHRPRSAEDELDRAFEGYYAIAPVDESSEGMSRFFVERRQYLENLSPEMRQRVLDTQEQRAAQISETERAYVLATRDYDAYSKIPKRIGLPNERTDPAEAVLRRAKALVGQRPGMTVGRAIMADPRADAQAKYDALSLERGRYRSNATARRTAFARSKLLGAFYREIVLDEVENLVAAG